MAWWGWMVLGVMLVIVELVVMDAAFYLMFVGVAAVLVGLLAIALPDASMAGMVMLFGVTSLVLMVGFRRKLYERMKARNPGFSSAPVGVLIRIDEDIPPDGDSRIEYRGARWAAHNVSKELLPAGSRVVVRGMEGTTLLVARDGDPVPVQVGQEQVARHQE